MAELSTQTSSIVSKVWGLCNPLRDDGVSYGDYLEQLTYLIFLKMADEYSKPPYNRDSGIPAGCTWQDMRTLKGTELEDKYKAILETLGKQSGLLGSIFFQSSNKISKAAILKRVVDMIDGEKWVSMSSDVKGDIYEGLLQKNAEDTKSGAGQYFTPRSLIRTMVRCMRPEPGKTIADPCCGSGGFFLASQDFIANEYRETLDREQKELLDISAALFKLYSALAVKTDDPGVWNDFFNEPILSYVIYDENFRGFMTDSFPDGDRNKSAITEHIGIYKQDVADRRLAEEKKKARARLIKKTANIWMYLAAGIGTAGVILFFSDYYFNFNGSLLLSTACALIAFAAYCPFRYNVIMTKINNVPAKPAVPPSMYIALSLLFMGIGIASIFEHDSFTNINGMCSLAIVLVTAIAEILLMTVFKPSLKHYS